MVARELIPGFAQWLARSTDPHANKSGTTPLDSNQSEAGLKGTAPDRNQGTPEILSPKRCSSTLCIMVCGSKKATPYVINFILGGSATALSNRKLPNAARGIMPIHSALPNSASACIVPYQNLACETPNQIPQLPHLCQVGPTTEGLASS